VRLRLGAGFVLFLCVFFGGGIGYYVIGLAAGKGWALGDCFFMTALTITTVGYGDVLGVMGSPGLQVYTVILAFFGMGVILYLVTSATAFVVEGELTDIFRRRAMERLVRKLRDHFIVCGAGETGKHVIVELLQTKRPLVAVDQDEAAMKRLSEGVELPYIVGDCTEEEVLTEAGIERASGLCCALPTDKDNLFLVVTARALNPRLRIVARAVDERAVGKLRGAGADSVVSTNLIGGLRVVSELVRPTVVTFLDTMLRERGGAHRFEELSVSADSPLAGKTLSEAKLNRGCSLLAVAVRRPGEANFSYAPGGDAVLEPGSTVVVLAEAEDIPRARKALGG